MASPPPADPSKQHTCRQNDDIAPYCSRLLPDFVLHSRLICESGTILELSLESGEGDTRFLRTGRQNGGLVICTPRARSDPSKQRNCRHNGVGPSKTAQLSSKPATERRLRLMLENDDLLLVWEP